MSEKINYERLRTLYSIGKSLSTFVSVEASFPHILKSAAEAFPLMSAVLIEHWENKPKIAVWFSSNGNYEEAAAATMHAKEAYCFLSGANAEETKAILSGKFPIFKLSRDEGNAPKEVVIEHNYIGLPLIIDYLPPFGALQLEGSRPLDEGDLEFAHALTNLMSVALDRFYKTKKEAEYYANEAKKNFATINSSKNRIAELEIEKDLREAFVSLLTHDLKTPLSIMSGSAEMILKKNESPETCKKYAQNILHQSERVNQMITDLLDANRINSGGGLALKKDYHDLRDLLKETVSELIFLHGDRFKVIGDEPNIAYCDSKAIKRVIENLCGNAIKYGSSDSPITISLKTIDSIVQISVNNKGDPIPEEDQKHLFEQYRRTLLAESGWKPGWGIGLTLVRGVAEAHGGTVKVTSDVDSGTTFTVTFPK